MSTPRTPRPRIERDRTAPSAPLAADALCLALGAGRPRDTLTEHALAQVRAVLERYFAAALAATELGVSYRTMRDWIARYPELAAGLSLRGKGRPVGSKTRPKVNAEVKS